MTDTTASEADASSRTTVPDPETLRERDDVEVVSRDRTVEREQFEGLQRRYDAIDGVVMVGVVDDDGRVLLQGDDEVAPPGGDVEPGEDWAAAARRRFEELTGVAVAVDAVECYERTEFHCEDGDESFVAPALHVRLTLAEDAPGFREDPQALDEPDHAYYDDGDEVRLGWYDDVPADVHPNHAEHVALYLD